MATTTPNSTIPPKECSAGGATAHSGSQNDMSGSSNSGKKKGNWYHNSAGSTLAMALKAKKNQSSATSKARGKATNRTAQAGLITNAIGDGEYIALVLKDGKVQAADGSSTLSFAIAQHLSRNVLGGNNETKMERMLYEMTAAATTQISEYGPPTLDMRQVLTKWLSSYAAQSGFAYLEVRSMSCS